MDQNIKTNSTLPNLEYPAEYQKIPIPAHKCFPPRSFQGYEPLAYIRDLLTLQRRVVKWLTGSDDPYAISSLISSYGFLPLNVSGLADSSYFGVETEYNTTLINNKVIDYNFFGKNVKITQSAERTDKVNIEIKQLKCASNLGTSDGLTDGNIYLSETTQLNATTGILPELISIPDTKINLGDWNDYERIDIYKYNENRFQIETKDYINFAESGTFFVIGFLTENSQTTQIVQSQLILPGMCDPSLSAISALNNQNVILAGQNQHITFSISDWTIDDGDTYKAKIKASFNLNEIFKDQQYDPPVIPSRFKISISHHNYNAVSFGTYMNWERWITADPEINNYIQKNIYTWQSVNYLYMPQYPLSCENVTYQFDSIKTLSASNIPYIYEGNIIFHINEINNLYNLAATDNNVILSTNITDQEYIYSSSYFSPSTNLFQANKNINFNYTVPIKQNIYTNTFEANIILKNATNSVQFISSFTTPIYINTINKNVCSTSGIYENFYDNDSKENNNKFGQKYRIGFPFDKETDLKVIPGIGLFYTSGIQTYIRKFETSSRNYIITFNKTNIIDIEKFKENIFIQDNTENWINLIDYITGTYSTDNHILFYVRLNEIFSNLTLKLQIDNTIANENSLILENILIDDSKTDLTIHDILLRLYYLKIKVLE